MLLLNAITKKLEEFHHDPPSYAAFSHRWRLEEVQFHDIQAPHAPSMAGYAKIEGCCAQALQDGYSHVWIDTCCIDKNSSAVLSEAINSMYAWYKGAHICYTYLDDVRSDEDPLAEGSSFEKSEWFTRGWTLQELLAPESVFFFAADWTVIGSKVSLADKVANITGISKEILVSARLNVSLSIATRMSWAAGRKTTKEEDRAYSLMGIFDVHMPILYGEGEKKAFFRLQNEIMHSTNDQSIFAWRYPLSHGSFGYGPLAVSVDLFAGSRDIHCIPPDIWIKYCNNIIPGVVLRLDFATTNDGLHINLPLQPLGDDRFLALLSCSHRPTYSVVAEAGHILHVEPYSVVGIHLRQSIRGIEHYERVDGHVLDDIYTSQLTAAGSSGFVLRDVHIGDSLRALGMVSESHIAPSIAQFLVQIAGVRESGYDVAEVDAVEKCTVEKREDGNLGLRIRRSFQGRSRIATIKFENPDTKKVFEVILGMSWDWGEGEGPLVYLSPQRSEASQDPIGNRDLRMDWATMRLGTDELVSVGVKKGGALIFGGSRSLVTENHLVTVQVRKVGAQSMGR